MKKFIVITLAFLQAMPVWAANLPLSSSKIRSADDLAERAMTGRGLNVTPEQYLAHVQSIYPDAGATSKEGLVVFLKNLSPEACPAGERTLTSFNKASGNFSTLKRAYRAGEMCLWDRNTGRVFTSMDCANIDVTRTPTPTPSPRVYAPPPPPPPAPPSEKVVVYEGVIGGQPQPVPQETSTEWCQGGWGIVCMVVGDVLVGGIVKGFGGRSNSSSTTVVQQVWGGGQSVTTLPPSGGQSFNTR